MPESEQNCFVTLLTISEALEPMVTLAEQSRADTLAHLLQAASLEASDLIQRRAAPHRATTLDQMWARLVEAT